MKKSMIVMSLLFAACTLYTPSSAASLFPDTIANAMQLPPEQLKYVSAHYLKKLLKRESVRLVDGLPYKGVYPALGELNRFFRYVREQASYAKEDRDAYQAVAEELDFFAYELGSIHSSRYQCYVEISPASGFKY